MSFNIISVIGLGYIGLPTAAMFASKAKKVIGVDVNQHTVDTINAGKIHIVEPELDEMVKEAVHRKFLKATALTEPADAFLIAVPTPFLPLKIGEKIPKPDLSFIESASEEIAKVLKKGDLVILESTSPVGTTEQMADWLAAARSDLTFPQTHGEKSDVRIAHCPERVLPGHVVRELIENDRVIGGMSQRCAEAAAELYQTFVEGEILQTTAKTAEMAKLTENAFRDVNIAFANELSIVCDYMDIDVKKLLSLANRHPRVNILNPSCGVGGHCISVDPWFIVDRANGKAKLIEQARRINDYKADWVLEKVKSHVIQFEKDNSRIPTIACMGLAFKPDIDDLRQSPALYISEKLDESLNLVAVEPNIDTHNFLEVVSYKEGLKADICVYLVAHKQFDLNNFKENDLDFCGLK